MRQSDGIHRRYCSTPSPEFVQPTSLITSDFFRDTTGTFRVDTATGFVLVDPAVRVELGDIVAVQWNGYPMLCRFCGNCLLTEEGESFEGEALAEVSVLGKVRWRC